jgi:hypothetical protein
LKKGRNRFRHRLNPSIQRKTQNEVLRFVFL